MESYEHPVQHQTCQVCGHPLEVTKDLQDKGHFLDPDEIGICERCGTFLIMGDDGLLSPLADQSLVSHRDRQGRRMHPKSIAQLLEVQRAVCERAAVVVTNDADGTTSVERLPRLDGPRGKYGVN